jgi:signal transduction histidine kinase
VGEAVNCINAFKSEGGCGTTEFCCTCGAVNAMVEAKTELKSEKECRILTANNNAFDLRVKATQLDIEGEMTTIFTLNDISSEKRKQTLERVFFHDVLNSAGGISGLSEIMPDINDRTELMEVAEMISRASENLISEIQAQRYLVAAENGDLTVENYEIESFKILKDQADLYSKHEIIGNKYISIHKESENIIVTTDAVLLRRIIGNMIKNALEASLPETVVTISSKKNKEVVRFSVHNGTYIPRDVQLQLFQRSFSTKGIGRGLGTYSMKLLGEKYLKGKVGFESTIENGTTFYFEI